MFKVVGKSVVYKEMIIVKEISVVEEKLYFLCNGNGVLRVRFYILKVV